MTSVLAIGAEANLDFCCRILVEGAENEATLKAIELGIFQLWKDATVPGDNARDADEIIKVGTSEVVRSGRGRQLGDADMDLRVDMFVVGVIEQDRTEGDTIEDDEHACGAVGKEISENRFRISQVQVEHLKSFGVHFAEIANALTVYAGAMFVNVGHEKNSGQLLPLQCGFQLLTSKVVRSQYDDSIALIFSPSLDCLLVKAENCKKGDRCGTEEPNDGGVTVMQLRHGIEEMSD